MLIVLVLLAGIGLASCQSPSQACLTDFKSAILAQHNTYRTLHKVALQSENVTLTATAQNYSNYLASNGFFQHSRYPGMGENLYMTGGTVVYSNGTKACYYKDSASTCSGKNSKKKFISLFML